MVLFSIARELSLLDAFFSLFRFLINVTQWGLCTPNVFFDPVVLKKKIHTKKWRKKKKNKETFAFLSGVFAYSTTSVLIVREDRVKIVYAALARGTRVARLRHWEESTSQKDSPTPNKKFFRKKSRNLLLTTSCFSPPVTFTDQANNFKLEKNTNMLYGSIVLLPLL